MGHEWQERMEFTLDATPEQVWEAIATGPGIDCWYMGRTEVEPREGGTVRTDLGGFVQQSTVTAWDPPKRFGYRMPADENGSFLALEWLIEGREGGSTVLRSVGSGFIGGDDWEAEYDSLRKGGAFYMHNLAQYITHFAGRAATPISAALPQQGDPAQLWTTLKGGLGLMGTIAEGDRVRLTPYGLAPIEGVVDYATPDFLGVRTDDALYRFFPRMGMAAVEHHIFSDDVDRRETEQAWQAWLARLSA